jgi:glycosyltransferase involved in cell wall biosynthesis
LTKENRGVRILWVGRMLDWKRVDLLLYAASLIFEERNFEHLDIVGTGPTRVRLMKLANKLNLDKKVTFHEPKPPETILDMMKSSEIYVLSSNRGEGWGVVANEAISEGCVLVANGQAGASLELIKHGITGFIFKDDSPQDLANVLNTLINSQSLRDNVRRAAYEKLNTLWHPTEGATRLVSLCAGLLGRSPMPDFIEGPCRNVAVKR